jgi:SnoaL-like domain
VSPEELERAVVALQDRQAIQDVLMTYSRGIDRLDRELLLSVYHDDAIDDHGVFVGSPEEFAVLRTGAQPARDRSDASYDRPLTIDETRAERFREVA